MTSTMNLSVIGSSNKSKVVLSVIGMTTREGAVAYDVLFFLNQFDYLKENS